jgi:hypothetical protein
MRAPPLVALVPLAMGLAACAAIEGLDKLQKVDALVDGGPVSDGASSGFCASKSGPLFCDDFESHGLPGPWATFHQTGGSLTIDEATSTSPPASLLEQATPLSAGTIDLGLRTAPLAMPALPATVHVEVAFDPVQVDPTPNAGIVIASLDFDDAIQNRYSIILTLFPESDVLTLSLGEQTGFVDGGTAYTPHTVPTSIPKATWTRIAIDVTFTDATTATAQLSLGGASAFSPPVALHPTFAGMTQILFGIGSTYETVPSAGWTLRYDDVLVTSGAP